MKWRILFLILFAQSTLAQASTWVEILTSSSGTVTSIDADTVKSEKTYSGEIVSAWFQNDYSKDETVPEDSAKSLEQFRCDRRESNLKYLITYDSNGNVVNNFDNPRQEFRPVVPDTIGEAKMIWACTLAGQME